MPENLAVCGGLDDIATPTLSKNMSKKILLVDDEAGFTQLLKMNLERTGRFQVCVQNDPTKALKTAREFQPDAMFLDVVMPEMDGGDVQAQFAADPVMSKLPIIMLTALVNSSELSEGAVAQSGENLVLPKPVDLNLMLRVLDEVVGL